MSWAPTDNIGFCESRVDPHQLMVLTELPGSQPRLRTVGAAGYRHIPVSLAPSQDKSPDKILKCSKTKRSKPLSDVAISTSIFPFPGVIFPPTGRKIKSIK